MIGDVFYTRLQAVSAVTDLVGARVYPEKTENQNPTSPYVTYEILHTSRESAMGSDSGNVRSEMRVHIWAKPSGSASAFAVAQGVSAAIRGAFQRFRGTVGGVVVEDVFCTDEFTVQDPDPGWRHLILEFEAMWRE